MLRIDAPYSTSFLDGFILGLAKDRILEAVMFEVADDRTLAQLERVSGVRKFDIYYYAGGEPAEYQGVPRVGLHFGVLR